jgi:putative transposase
MQYRRTYIPGTSYFFTVVTNQRRAIFNDETTIDNLREAFRQIMIKRPFTIDAIVILPDHLHCIWTLPNGDTDYATRWRLIKTWFTKHQNQTVTEKNKPSIWQKRYWEHLLRNEKDYHQHIDYIHYNPVKHKHVQNPSDWKYSSFRQYVKKGILRKDWGASEITLPENIGNE